MVWVRFLPPLESGTVSWLRWLRLRFVMTCPRLEGPALVWVISADFAPVHGDLDANAVIATSAKVPSKWPVYH